MPLGKLVIVQATLAAQDSNDREIAGSPCVRDARWKHA